MYDSCLYNIAILLLSPYFAGKELANYVAELIMCVLYAINPHSMYNMKAYLSSKLFGWLDVEILCNVYASYSAISIVSAR